MPTINPVPQMQVPQKSANVSFQAAKNPAKAFVEEGWDFNYNGKTSSAGKKGSMGKTLLKVAIGVAAVGAALKFAPASAVQKLPQGLQNVVTKGQNLVNTALSKLSGFISKGKGAEEAAKKGVDAVV